MLRAEERNLIARAAAGDRSAGESLIRAHQDSLYAYILRMSGRPDVAEDIVQEAFVRVLTHLDRFDPQYRFSTWLFTIAKRLYVNACQKHKPVYDSDVVGSRRSAVHAPDAPAIEDETRDNARDALQDALLALNEDQREVVLLFHQHNWPIALIAQHIGMPEGTVKSHLHRARRKMRDVLESTARRRASVEEAWT